MATYEPFYNRTMELPEELLVGAIDSQVPDWPVDLKTIIVCPVSILERHELIQVFWRGIGRKPSIYPNVSDSYIFGICNVGRERAHVVDCHCLQLQIADSQKLHPHLEASVRFV